MQVHIATQKVAITPSFRSEIVEQLKAALQRFADGIREIRVELRDRNGRRGGGDKRIRIRVQLAAGEPVLVEEERASLQVALRRAAGRAATAVRRTLTRR